MRDLAPAVLRYHFLDPGPGKRPWIVCGVTGGFGMGATVAGAFILGAPLLALLAPIVGAVAGAVTSIVAGPLEPLRNLHAAAVDIVPWGIVIDPDGKPEPIPWSGVRSIRYTVVSQETWQGEGSSKTAVLTFAVGSRRIQAMGEEGEWVLTVCQLHKRLARAAERRPAADIAGTEGLDLGGLSAPLALASRAEAILDSADGRATLGLQSGGYRTAASTVAGEETRGALRAALFDGAAPFDPGPLACLLAARLGVGSLLPDVLQLVLSPSPLVAATARAAAVRLGASLMSAGSLGEVRHFLPAAELADLRAWMGGAG